MAVTRKKVATGRRASPRDDVTNAQASSATDHGIPSAAVEPSTVTMKNVAPWRRPAVAAVP